ncbi:6,7-dimethyl-8-ribityllumazine synthase [Methyloraptor flagellatus]|jgi:6,7-dimethyl-8-ribityllumazine synthase|uniref:6,7-dimethyl-8-ribityllumazine synthase n=1 Tax=Methyloraptor flagellatus TaxID=3162530 RepID=A0AAU7XFQ8_9HYPH
MSTKLHHADYSAEEVAGSHVLIVEARFNAEIADALKAGAVAVLEQANVSHDVISVPGALEIPAAIAFALKAEDARGRTYDGYVALGCVIRGETTHYDIVSNESSRALMDLAVDRCVPIGNGILTVENDDQAWDRARADRLDKGGGAAAACLAMIALRRQLAG